MLRGLSSILHCNNGPFRKETAMDSETIAQEFAEEDNLQVFPFSALIHFKGEEGNSYNG